MYLISVIVPIYNAEQYLERCLESIVKQSSEKLPIEAILINDGSEDNSEAICRTFSQRYSFINTITIPNSGVSNARNIGMSYAKGKYIVFVDADDYLMDYALMDMYRQAESDNELLVIGSVQKINFDGNTQSVRLPVENKIIENKDKEDLLYHYLHSPRKYNLLRFVWGKLFVRQIIQEYDIKFDVGLTYCEDALFMMEYLSKITKIIYINKEIYVYCTNQVNIGSNEVFKHPLAFGDSLNTLSDYLKESSCYKKEQIANAYRDGFVQLAMASLFHLIRLHPTRKLRETMSLYKTVNTVIREINQLGLPWNYKALSQENLPIIFTFIRWKCTLGVIAGFKYQISRIGKRNT